MTIESIARACHNANADYCKALGDFSQKYWEEAEAWQRESCIKGVEFRLKNKDAPISANHASWLEHKEKEGWKYGEKKDPVNKLHPCMVPFDQLPLEQQLKDELFTKIVLTYSKLLK